MNFKHFFEMSHLIPRKNGKIAPFMTDNGMVQGIDMGFEHYPDNSLKAKFSHIDAKFYGEIPHQNKFIVFDGRNLEVKDYPPAEPGYMALPPDWADYARFEYVDGHFGN